MLSRVACNTYWMSRYVERAENVARFIEVNLQLMMDLTVEHKAQWDPLIIASGDHERFRERYGEPSEENVIEFLTFDREYPSSILSCFRAARENARTVREVISSEVWEHINRTYLTLIDTAARDRVAQDPYEFYESIKTAGALFEGFSDATMSREDAWQFIRLGRMIERADKTSRILDVKYFYLLPNAEYVGTPYDNLQWAAVLKSASALEMYRLEHHRITPTNVIGFLILSNVFPRAMRYCVAQADHCLHDITGFGNNGFSNEAERCLGRLRSDLDFGKVDDIIAQGVHEYIDGVQTRLNEAGNAIHETFFALRPASEIVMEQRQ